MVGTSLAGMCVPACAGNVVCKNCVGLMCKYCFGLMCKYCVEFVCKYCVGLMCKYCVEFMGNLHNVLAHTGMCVPACASAVVCNYCVRFMLACATIVCE